MRHVIRGLALARILQSGPILFCVALMPRLDTRPVRADSGRSGARRRPARFCRDRPVILRAVVSVRARALLTLIVELVVELVTAAGTFSNCGCLGLANRTLQFGDLLGILRGVGGLPVVGRRGLGGGLLKSRLGGGLLETRLGGGLALRLLEGHLVRIPPRCDLGDVELGSRVVGRVEGHRLPMLGWAFVGEVPPLG